MSTDTAVVAPGAGGVQARPSVWGDAGQLAVIALQLGVILILTWAFNLESRGFSRVVLPLAFGGFLVHHWLPRRFQPLFFAALSLAGIAIIFGWVAGAWLVGAGLGLIALCHLPIPFRARVVVVVLAAGALVAMRSTWLPTPWPGVIWPILGSMFMFRLAVYLYDLKHHGPASPGMVLSYFFMLPNTVFLLFPVIDFQTFRRTHYDKPAFGIYDEGVKWMFRGLTHLVLYRVIYQYVALSPVEVTSTAGIVQYLVGNYGLYLRVSGQFHVIVGLLHLFGFRLPETHRFFYLASSLSDIWRRMNIYWKDFMQKMVYLPVMFGLKRRRETTALVAATACVITATWLLHSYQWFWLLGTWLFSATDMMFWGILGVLLIANTLREQKRGRVRQLSAQMPSPRYVWRGAIQTAAMFTLMCCLWGFWTSPTFEDFRVMLRSATFRPIDGVAVVGTFAVVVMVAFVTRRYGLDAPSALVRRPQWQHPLVVSAVPLALFWLAGESVAAGHVPAPVHAIAQQARLVELNKYDAERLQRGYYEKIVGVNRFNGQLWEVYARAATKQEPEDVLFAEGIGGAGDGRIWQRHHDALENSLKPLNHTEFKGGRFSTNRWGMRDRDYEKAPPTRTRRIAVLGQSYTMGAGVNDDETFEALIEDRLNREWSAKTGLRYEALNFAVSGYTLSKQVRILQNGRVGQFQPQVVLIVGNPADVRMMVSEVARLTKKGIVPPGPVQDWLDEAGVSGETPAGEIGRLLQPHLNDLARWAFESMATEVRRMGAQPVWALIPLPKEKTRDTPEAGKSLLSLAVDAGFLVIDMQDVYAGHDLGSLILNEADNHPNAEGHRTIAERLYAELMKHPGILASRGDTAVARAQADWVATWTAKRTEEIAAMRGPKTREQLLEELKVKSRANVKKGRPILKEGIWRLILNQGAVATLIEHPTEDRGLRVTITAVPKSVGWHVKLRETPFALTQGRDYRITFRARAAASRPMAVGAEGDVKPYKPQGFYKELDVTTAWETFEWTFTAEGTDPTTRIFFDLGTSTTSVDIADVVLLDVAAGREVKPTPVRRRRK